MQVPALLSHQHNWPAHPQCERVGVWELAFRRGKICDGFELQKEPLEKDAGEEFLTARIVKQIMSGFS